jgi:ubiquinone/menaquinone biosynthesis C-methylase UbiE
MLMLSNDIKEYYNRLASTYDSDRFGNTYGQYIHRQEERLLRRYLTRNKNLNLGCGTGRFMENADIGIDISQEMIKEAQKKYPCKKFFLNDARHISFANNSFDNIFCFHVIMHLPQEITLSIINEAERIVKRGGTIIFDFPSRKRRSLFGKKPLNWHGASAYSIDEIKELAKLGWTLKRYAGILFFPIHRMPAWSRKFFQALDCIICNSFLKEYASYIMVVLEKK